MNAYVHPTAIVEDHAAIGEDTKVWHQAQIRTRAVVGARCIIGKGAFVDTDVVLGDDCKLQNYACVYHGVTLGRGVFVGPHAVFTNDVFPRSTDPNFGLLRDGDWEVGTTRVEDGASIGACATILPNVTIGKWATVGAGAVVTRDVEPYALVVGSPARRIGWVCRCGRRVESARCARCGDLPEDHPLASGITERHVPAGA
jgi:UDP-2-acetamido-3-amino-2,3-dideoxy-glucuronate N-acetyltransferase